MENLESKKCSKCGEVKERGEFSVDKRIVNGLQAQCKKCQKERLRKKGEINKNRDFVKLYENRENETKICSICKLDKNVFEGFAKDKYSDDGFTCACKECRNKQKIIYRSKEENREKEKVSRREYYQSLEGRKVVYAYRKWKKENDVCFRIRCDVSSRICNILKGNGGSKNGDSIFKYLPYTIQELKEYLESQFEPWMNWQNWAPYDPHRKTWHIEHIIPCSNFYYTTMDCEEFRKCWALTNLRPLLAKENLVKGNRILF